MASRMTPADRSILSSAMTVNAMRDARYKHPANAIAEIIDNSIDAFATDVELLIEEHQERVATRMRWRVHSLAVLDNGDGMDEETLGQALRFGGRVARPGIRKIGKYGMGLPTASVSQCKRLDVWSWQAGIENAYHAYLDINEIQSDNQNEIVTEQQPPPKMWIKRAKLDTSEKGTLVVWSDTDRIKNQPDTIFDRLSEEIGRTYRHYIKDGDVRIRMAAYRGDSTRVDERVLPNDPMYLMTPSSTPEPWSDQPMFRPVPDMDKDYQIQYNGKMETVEVRYSMVKSDAAAIGENNRALPGNTKYGWHARRNMGVSVVRENREIILDDNCVDTSEGGGIYPQNRWWGCEVRFNSDLDDVFGVDHNKQMTSSFSQLLKQTGFSSAQLGFDLEDELDADSGVLARIAKDIRNSIGSLMRQITIQFRQRPRVQGGDQDTSKSTPAEQAEKLATDTTEQNLQNQGTTITPTDEAFATTNSADKISVIAEVFVAEGYEEEKAKEEAVLVVNSGNRYRFVDSVLPGYYVFQAEPRGGILLVKLNVNHRFYQYLNALEMDIETNEDTKNETAAVGLRLAILALARMDDEFIDRDARLKFQENCEHWGRMLHRIIDEGSIYAGE